uniref:PLA2c domain-containing protein n=1 Tax=Leptobrachium leishanense TaxID=445787 RepID=A0A8C5Q8E4_9ANUR
MDIKDGEKISVLARLKKVQEAFKRLGIHTNKDDVPVVAVLGSGGGLRAMIGFLGVLTELSNQDFLDTVTYICGTSGSTWCMASLYNSDNWSTSMTEMERTMCERLGKNEWDWAKSWEKIKQLKESESLTAFWAYVVIQIMTKEINEKKLSDHRAACEVGKNPYPVYAAIERENLDYGIPHKPGTWFEFTPHKVGFPAFQHFVDTKFLGSQFEDGAPSKITPEKELCFLQGQITDALSKAHIITSANTDNDYNESNPTKCEKCKRLHTLLTEDQERMSYQRREELLFILTQFMDDNTFEEKKKSGVKKRHKHFVWGLDYCNVCKVIYQLLVSFAKWRLVATHNSQHNSGDKGFCEIWKIIHKLMVLLAKWEWGTTYNFLYNPNVSDGATNDIFNKEYLHLIDAGLELNTAYPLMLMPHRKVDLILSFDFSEGDPFKTLTDAREYCTINNIPFPIVDINVCEEAMPSKHCYIFEGDDKDVPTVMHFPLFNRKNCGDDVLQWRKRYPTAKLSYTNSDIEDLIRVSKQNVRFTKNLILEKLQNLCS